LSSANPLKIGRHFKRSSDFGQAHQALLKAARQDYWTTEERKELAEFMIHAMDGIHKTRRNERR
jgi:hypothetical protein